MSKTAKQKQDPVSVPRKTMERILTFVASKTSEMVFDGLDSKGEPMFEDMNDDDAIELLGDIRVMLGYRRSAL